jgi:superfamily II DNA or RNA helicase
MDERLIAADPREVRRFMARAFLATPSISTEQGEIRLAPHQVEAASRLLDLLGACSGAVLADATGLGKTYVAIAIARVMGPTVVVAPAALRGMWRESLERCGVVARIDSYEALSRGPPLVSSRPALLVLDEAHHARNPRARRYAAIADLAWGTRVLLLSATTIHNRGRDLRALVALFLGSRAFGMIDDELRGVMVQRTPRSLGSVNESLPVIGAPRWLDIPGDGDTLRTIRALPPAVPVADGGSAHALLQLGLIRAWTSSHATLRAMLKRRLRRAAALSVALDSGRLPDRRELGSWPVVDGAIQLGFPELVSGTNSVADVMATRERLDRHVDGVRLILAALDGAKGAGDEARTRLLSSIRDRHRGTPIVAFTQFADTAESMFRAVVHQGGVALVSGRGARIASGSVNVDEIVRRFDTVEPFRTTSAMPLYLLIATDVLSEGLSLRRAGVIVHLDLPWTMARLEQRVGRLRRLGSRHQRIAVYAIGPPIGARELATIVRALQRKSRLASNISGTEELHSSLPLFGTRLSRATSAIARRAEPGAMEELRRALSAWEKGTNAVHDPRRPDSRHVALGLVAKGTNHRLVAVTDNDVSARPSDVLRAVQVLSAGGDNGVRPDFPALQSVDAATAAIAKWLDEERGREMARPATDTPSPAHVAILRALQECLTSAPRAERAALVRRVDDCRQLVIDARGIGAEFAMARLVGGAQPLNLGALEQLLTSRALSHAAARGTTVLRAVLAYDADRMLAARAGSGCTPSAASTPIVPEASALFPACDTR